MQPSLRPSDPIENLAIGTLIEVNGSRIIAELSPDISELSRTYGGEMYPVGQFGSIIKVHFGQRLIYALVDRLRMKAEYEAELGAKRTAFGDERIVEADLFGEGQWRLDDTGEPELQFERGVATYPLPQQTVYLTPKSELRSIYGGGAGPVIQLGQHVGSGESPCYANLNELLGKHSAILGSTGSGKSCAVAAVIHAILDRGSDSSYQTWHPQIIILDPHNEYGTAFPDCSRLSTDEGSLTIPYWMLNLNETRSLLIGKTEYAATSQANIVKNALMAARTSSAQHLGLDVSKLTVDSPVPYILGNPSGLDDFGRRDGVLDSTGFVGAINSQRPSGETRSKHEQYSKVLAKLESLLEDKRLSFMMTPWDGVGDPIPSVLSQVIGTDSSSRVSIVDLSGVPNEVGGIASAAIARTLFSLKVWQSDDERRASPTLLVCEEAHRYVPNRGEAQYEAAQDAIRRIAKEGRKYGIGLMLVSQRPSEVEATVLSQCNSWIVLRVTNEADREHVRGILPDSLAGLSKMLSGLRRREAIFAGQAATLPSRILIRELPDTQQPRSQDIDFAAGWQIELPSVVELAQVARRWRYQERDPQSASE